MVVQFLNSDYMNAIEKSQKRIHCMEKSNHIIILKKIPLKLVFSLRIIKYNKCI